MKRRHLTPSLPGSILGLLTLFAPASAAPSQALPIDCSTAPLVPNKVLLTWPDVPTEDTVASLPSSSAPLVLTSLSSDTLVYELIGRYQVGGHHGRVALASGVLPPSGTGLVAVDFGGLGVDITDLAFSGRLVVEARSRDSAGALQDRAYSPRIFFHQRPGPTGGPELFLYGDAARRQAFNYGDLDYQLHTSSVPDPTLIGVFDGGAGIGRPGQGSGPPDRGPVGQGPGSITAPPKWEFCMRWVYESIDSGFGEDHYVAGCLMKARGMKVVVDHDNWATPKTFYCNDVNGCFSFEANENMGFEVTVYAEARLGGTKNVTVRGFEDQGLANQNDPEEVSRWMFVANPGGEPRRVYYQSGAGEVANMMAFGSFVFHWIDHQTFPRLAGPRSLVMVTSLCQGGSCQSGNQVRMAPGSTNRKFLVGHEVGHWLHRQWTEDDMGYDNLTWSANSGIPECAFNGLGSHAMRSKEYSVGAFIEGFAHYLSLIAWNEDQAQTAIFKYYKEIDDAVYDDMEQGNWRVDAEGNLGALGGTTNWMENECFVSDGHSVEMDWMRFFWDYRTDPGLPPTLYQIFELVAFTRIAHPWMNNLGAYDRMLESMLDGGLGQQGLANRFLVMAIVNGVDQ